MRMLRASRKIKNQVESTIRAIEHCRDARVLAIILQRVNDAADKATGADDLTQFRLIASIAERRLAELRADA